MAGNLSKLGLTPVQSKVEECIFDLWKDLNNLFGTTLFGLYTQNLFVHEAGLKGCLKRKVCLNPVGKYWSLIVFFATNLAVS